MADPLTFRTFFPHEFRVEVPLHGQTTYFYQLNHHRQAGQRAFVFDVRNIPAKERMNDMIAFLDEMPQAITEYSDAITGRLVEKVTIFDEKIVVELKSGLQMEVEA